MKYKIGDKVLIKNDLIENSVAYYQRGLKGEITAIDEERTFPYFVPLTGWNNRECWFWEAHLEYQECEHKLRVCLCCGVVVCDLCKREWGEPNMPEGNIPETYTYFDIKTGKRICCHHP